MTSIGDVARESGVSMSTVSRALRGMPNVSPETRAVVEATAERLAYVASPSATGLARGRHRAVAAVVPSLDRWFYGNVLEGADGVLRRAHRDLFVIDLAIGPDGRERLFDRSLLRKRADAVIALGIDFNTDERRELRALEMPSVLIGGGVDGMQTVKLDDRHAAGLVMQHLIELGHRRIAHVGGENEYGVLFSVADARRQAWADALDAIGVPDSERLFASGGFVLTQAKVAARALLTRSDRPTAIFAASDEMAFGVQLAAGELGIAVPRELSIVGIDDHDWSVAHGLTTVRQDPRAQGATAARFILAGLDGDADDFDEQLVTHGALIIRQTTAIADRN